MDNIELIIFHDERVVPHNWLYHSFILCKCQDFPVLHNDLTKAKDEASCRKDKRIHFSKLTSGSNGSHRTKTAVKWVELFKDEIYVYTWFYLFGINTSRVDYEFFGSHSDGGRRDYRIYNRFFEIGLFSACRYFFDAARQKVEISRIISERRDLKKDDPFLSYAPYKVNRKGSNVTIKSKCIIPVAGDLSREHDYPEYVDAINFVDVLMGAFCQCLDYTSQKNGCMEVASKIYPLCNKLSEKPYNKNSRYYKRCAMSFFPKKLHSKSEIMSCGIIPPHDQFYVRRQLRLLQPECLPGFEEVVK